MHHGRVTRQILRGMRRDRGRGLGRRIVELRGEGGGGIVHDGMAALGGFSAKARTLPSSRCRRMGGPGVYVEFGTVTIEGHPGSTEGYLHGDKTLRPPISEAASSIDSVERFAACRVTRPSSGRRARQPAPLHLDRSVQGRPGLARAAALHQRRFEVVLE